MMNTSRSPEPINRRSWKQKISLNKQKVVAQNTIDAATRDEEVEFSSVGRSFQEAEWTEQFNNTSSSQRVQTPVQRYGNDSFEDLLSATGTMADSQSQYDAQQKQKQQQQQQKQQPSQRHVTNQHQPHHLQHTHNKNMGTYNSSTPAISNVHSPTSSDLTSKFDVGQYSTPPRSLGVRPTPNNMNPENDSDIDLDGDIDLSPTGMSTSRSASRIVGVQLFTADSNVNEAEEEDDEMVLLDDVDMDEDDIEIDQDEDQDEDQVRFHGEDSSSSSASSSSSVVVQQGEPQQQPTPFRVAGGMSPMAMKQSIDAGHDESRSDSGTSNFGNLNLSNEIGIDSRRNGRGTQYIDDSNTSLGGRGNESSFLGTVERALTDVENKVGYRSRRNRQLPDFMRNGNENEKNKQVEEKEIKLPTIDHNNKNSSSSSSSSTTTNNEHVQKSSQDHHASNQPLAPLVTPMPTTIDDTTREKMDSMLGSLRKKQKRQKNRVQKKAQKENEKEKKEKQVPQNKTFQEPTAINQTQTQPLHVRVREVEDNEDKWNAVHSPHRRGRAQRRDREHVTSAPPNVSMLEEEDDEQEAKEQETKNWSMHNNHDHDEDDDDDEAEENDDEAPMWRSDIMDSAPVTDTIDGEKEDRVVHVVEQKQKQEKETPTRFTPKKINIVELQKELPVAALEKKFSEVIDDNVSNIINVSNVSNASNVKNVKNVQHDSRAWSDDEEEIRPEESREENREEREEGHPIEMMEKVIPSVLKSVGKKVVKATTPFQASKEIKRENYVHHRTPTTADVFPSSSSSKNERKVTQETDTKQKKQTPLMTTPANLDEYKLAVNPGSGEVYYYNRRTRVSQWDPPAPAAGIVVNMHEHPRHSQGRVRVQRRSEEAHTLEKAEQRQTEKQTTPQQQQQQHKDGDDDKINSRQEMTHHSTHSNTSTSASASATISVSASFSAGRRARSSTNGSIRSVTMRSRDENENDVTHNSRDDNGEDPSHLRSSVVSNDGGADVLTHHRSDRRPPDTATRKLVFDDRMRPMVMPKGIAHMDDDDIAAIQQLPEEIRQAAATLMAVSPAAPNGTSKAQTVSTLYCPYCGDPTQRSHLLEHLESGCSGVVKAVRDAEQEQKEQEETPAAASTSVSASSRRPPRSEERRRRPTTSIGYRTPEKSQRPASQKNSENVKPNNWTGGKKNYENIENVGNQNSQGEEEGSPMELHPCQHCRRTFAKERLVIHERICHKVFGEKRHTYDALHKRTHDTPFRATSEAACNQCRRTFASKEECLVHEAACGGHRSASRSRRKGSERPRSSGGIDDTWGRGSVASSVGGRGGDSIYDGGSAIKSARRSGGRRGGNRASFGSALRGGNSSMMLDTLDENEQSAILQDCSMDYDPERLRYDDEINLDAPPSVVRVTGEGSGSSLMGPEIMATPGGQYSSSRRHQDRSGTPSTSRSSARSSCPFCKRECYSSDLSSHLLRCKQQTASRCKVWRDSKVRQEQQKGASGSSARKRQHSSHRKK